MSPREPIAPYKYIKVPGMKRYLPEGNGGLNLEWVSIGNEGWTIGKEMGIVQGKRN